MTDPATPALSRRGFLSTSAKLGAVVMAAPYISRGAAAGGSDDINVALIGCGAQGRVLLNAAIKIPNLRFKAVCDIWPYNRTYCERLFGKFGHTAKPFEDYKEMLSAVPDLDAVIVATPDFYHAEHTNACLRAGKHVYCEKLMANNVENARSMVLTQRETKKLLQIGHQRRRRLPRVFHGRRGRAQDVRKPQIHQALPRGSRPGMGSARREGLAQETRRRRRGRRHPRQAVG
jgi:predicted dehydrogenase